MAATSTCTISIHWTNQLVSQVTVDLATRIFAELRFFIFLQNTMASHRQSWYWSEKTSNHTDTVIAFSSSSPKWEQKASVEIRFCKVCLPNWKKDQALLTELSIIETSSHNCQMCYFLLQAYRQCLPSDEQGTHLYVVWDVGKAEARLESPKNFADQSVTIGMKSSLVSMLPIIQSRSPVCADPNPAYE